MGPKIKTCICIWFAFLSQCWTQIIPTPMGSNQMMSSMQGAGLPPGLSNLQIPLPPMSMLPMAAMPGSPMGGPSMGVPSIPGSFMPSPPIPGMAMQRPLSGPLPGSPIAMPGMPAPLNPPYPPYGLIPQGYYGIRSQQEYYEMEPSSSDISSDTSDAETESEECRCSCQQCEMQVARWCCRPVCNLCYQQQQPSPGIHYLPYPYPMIITIVDKSNATKKNLVARTESFGNINITNDTIDGLVDINTDTKITKINNNYSIPYIEKSTKEANHMDKENEKVFENFIVDDIIKFSKQLESRLLSSYNPKKLQIDSQENKKYYTYNQTVSLWPKKTYLNKFQNKPIVNYVQTETQADDEKSTTKKVINKIKFHLKPIPHKNVVHTTQDDGEEIVITTVNPTKKYKNNKNKHKKKIHTTTSLDYDEETKEVTTAFKCSKEHVTTPGEELQTTGIEMQSSPRRKKSQPTITLGIENKDTEPSTTSVKLTETSTSTTTCVTTTSVPTTKTTTATPLTKKTTTTETMPKLTKSRLSPTPRLSTTNPTTTAVMNRLTEEIYIQKFRPVKSIKSNSQSQRYNNPVKHKPTRGAMKSNGKYVITTMRRMDGDWAPRYGIMPIPDDMAEQLMSQMQKMKIVSASPAKPNLHKSTRFTLDERLREIGDQVPGLDIIKEMNELLLDSGELRNMPWSS